MNLCYLVLLCVSVLSLGLVCMCVVCFVGCGNGFGGSPSKI